MNAAGPRVRTPSARVAPGLLSAAERVLDKEGRQGLTIRAVAVEACVAPMSVYNQFGGKAGLLEALRTRGRAQLEAAIAAGRLSSRPKAPRARRAASRQPVGAAR